MFEFDFLKGGAPWGGQAGARGATGGDAAPAPTEGYLACTALVDPQQHVRGYRVAWRPDSAPGDGADATRALLQCVARHLNPPGGGWRLGALPVFIDLVADELFLAELQALPGAHVVLCLQPAELAEPDVRALLGFLREQGFGIALRGADATPIDDELLLLATHLDVGAAEADCVSALRARVPADRPLPRMLATRMDDWAHFARCAAQHVDVFVLGQHGGPPQPVQSDELQPEAVLIVQLMQMIQRNLNVGAIESALKRDAALTWRLLRHINSPAIGVGVEITSLRHAVSMLGYSPLLRWLSVLLATSNGVGSPFMMKRAIMRGRFVELIGRGMLPASESDNLFVVGMFSLIDQLLGLPMPEVLARVPLNEAVQQAVLHRQGVYAPFLALVEAGARDERPIGPLAEALFVSEEQVNAAYLQAMSWSLDFSPTGSA